MPSRWADLCPLPNRTVSAILCVCSNRGCGDGMTTIDQQQMLSINQAGWDQVAARFYGGTALPIYGPLAPTEESLQLLDPLHGARVLELGCGSGHSLHYL